MGSAAAFPLLSCSPQSNHGKVWVPAGAQGWTRNRPSYNVRAYVVSSNSIFQKSLGSHKPGVKWHYYSLLPAELLGNINSESEKVEAFLVLQAHGPCLYTLNTHPHCRHWCILLQAVEGTVLIHMLGELGGSQYTPGQPQPLWTERWRMNPPALNCRCENL